MNNNDRQTGHIRKGFGFRGCDDIRSRADFSAIYEHAGSGEGQKGDGKMKETVINTTVPCNGCRQCCVNFPAIVLHPECGDDISAYETVEIPHPLTGNQSHMLKHKDNGDCIYLGASGCEIYDNRSIICREFDCRKMYLRFTKSTREHMVRNKIADKQIFDAGKKHQHTLSAAERRLEISKRNGDMK